MTKQDLIKSAKVHFEANPSHELYHVTADGQCFVKWHDANEHSKAIGNRELLEVKRDGSDASTIEDQLEAIADAETTEELSKLKPENKASKKVHEAYKTRYAELKQKEDEAAAGKK